MQSFYQKFSHYRKEVPQVPTTKFAPVKQSKSALSLPRVRRVLQQLVPEGFFAQGTDDPDTAPSQLYKVAELGRKVSLPYSGGKYTCYYTIPATAEMVVYIDPSIPVRRSQKDRQMVIDDFKLGRQRAEKTSLASFFFKRDGQDVVVSVYADGSISERLPREGGRQDLRDWQVKPPEQLRQSMEQRLAERHRVMAVA